MGLQGDRNAYSGQEGRWDNLDDEVKQVTRGSNESLNDLNYYSYLNKCLQVYSVPWLSP